MLFRTVHPEGCDNIYSRYPIAFAPCPSQGSVSFPVFPGVNGKFQNILFLNLFSQSIFFKEVSITLRQLSLLVFLMVAESYVRTTHEYLRFDFNGAPIEDDKIYKVGLQQFHYNNLEDFFNISFDEIKANGTPVVISTSCRGIFDEYLSNHQNLDREITGRLIVK